MSTAAPDIHPDLEPRNPTREGENAMTAAITQRDEDAGATSTRYQYTCIVEIAGHIVRTRLERGVSLNDSFAVAEVLNDDRTTWSSLAAERHAQHLVAHHTRSESRCPRRHRPRSAVRAAPEPRPLTSSPHPQAMLTLSPHVHGAISALLATSCGFDAERRIDPDEIAWAYAHGGRLHIIEHPRRQRHLHQIPPRRLSVHRQQRRSGLRRGMLFRPSTPDINSNVDQERLLRRARP